MNPTPYSVVAHRPARWWQREPVRSIRRWVEPFAQPARFLRAAWELPRFIREFVRYRKMAGDTMRPTARDLQPVFGQRGSHEIDHHYIYLNAWAARRVLARQPAEHVDVGSQLSFTSVLSAALPVRVVEFRPVPLNLDGIGFVEGSILALPFSSGSLVSVSCLHVIEHIGLARYGDPLDPAGTLKAARELARVLAPGGELLLGLPLGRARVCFNAHRIHDSAQVLAMFAGLRLVEFSGVDDAGRFAENRPLAELDGCEYACGFFRFTK